MWVGDVVGGRFLVERPVGGGGMGIVFRALDQSTGTPVAIKILDTGDADVRARFDREAEVLEQLSHPAIVRHVAHGEVERGPYLVMELLEGDDLSTHLLRVRPSVEETVALVSRAAEGLAEAHRQGVVHRDVKPANLFLVDGRAADLKLLDFGIARTAGRGAFLTQSNTLLGTVGYMAPEQVLRAKHVDARADVFALGCVLYECLTGKPAFSGPNAVVTVTKTMFEDPPAPSVVLPGCPPTFDDLVARMLDKEPDRRPRDAEAVLAELGRVRRPGSVAPRRERPHDVAARPEHAGVIVALPEILSLESSDTVSADESAHRDMALSQLAARFDAQLCRLEGGGVLLELDAGTAEDAAKRASACAAGVKELEPSLSVAVATGRLQDGGLAAIIERADEVLRAGAMQRRDRTLNVVAEDRVRLRSPALQAFLSRPRETRKLGPFLLERPLGKGGFAPVWLATEVYDGIELRKAAVKLFAFDGASAKDNATGYREHVVREARSLCQVEHPNIVRFYSLLIDDAAGVVGLAMEYLMGTSLADRLRAAGPLEPEEARRVGIRLASALVAAHAVGIVHRDVKPANVMESPGGHKLIDFGIATDEPASAPTLTASRVLPDDLPLDFGGTRMSMVVGPGSVDPDRTAPLGIVASGTVGYIDPACVATGATATPASDLYSLGALLFECVTGTLPAMAVGAHPGLSGAVLDGRAAAPRVAELAPEVPGALGTLIDRLLSPDRERRPATAEETLLALEGPLAPEERAVVNAAAPAPPRARAPVVAALVAAAVTASAFFFRGPSRSADESPPPAVLAVATAPSPQPQPARPVALEGRVTVVPLSATVEVDGTAARRDESGRVLVTGEAGTTFAVVVHAGTRTTTERVVLLRDGRTEPERIEVREATAAPLRPRKGTPVGSAAAAASAAPAPPALKPAEEFQ